MAKVSISFNLDEGLDDLNDVSLALYAPSLANVIFELDAWLKRMEKYEDKTFVAIGDVRAQLRAETEGLPIIW